MRLDSLSPQNGRNGGSEGRKTALVLKAFLRGESSPENPLQEIRALAETAGVEVVASLSQRLAKPHPATYLGRGKVEEAARLAADYDVDFVIADNDLSPAQERNLERITGRTVLDRSQLIMDIFAQRARTRQAKLQVELAQLRYAAPRLKRLWTHLSRYEGGIGMRGPGETQLETDKRLIARRIQRLVRELKRIEKRRELEVERRSGEFVVALVGYTNAGKSTLLNALTGSAEMVEDKLFATLDTRVRRWRLAPGRHVLLTDTVGFIRDLPPHLVASFHATLAETRAADLLLHVVDASSPQARQHIRTVREVLGRIECGGKPAWLVLNKWDRVPPERLVEARALGCEKAGSGAQNGGNPPAWTPPPVIEVSAREGTGLDELARAVLAYLERDHLDLVFALPHQRGDVLAYLRENATHLETRYEDDAVRVRCRLSPARAERLRRLYPEALGVG